MTANRVLLIDDDDLIAGSLRDYLRTRGWTVDVALEPAAAHAFMSERPYSIIVVDPYLTARAPEHLSLIGRIRELQPRSAMIVLTAYGSAELHESAAAHRAAAVLPKPQPVAYLSELIAGASQRGV